MKIQKKKQKRTFSRKDSSRKDLTFGVKRVSRLLRKIDVKTDNQ